MKSSIKGIMLRHTDGDFEYYSPKLSEEDENLIFSILEKYGDGNPSARGDEVEDAHKNLLVLAVD